MSFGNENLGVYPLPSRQLATAATRIDADPTMRVIWHEAWTEQIRESGDLIKHPINLSFKSRFDTTVDGFFELKRGRFIHLNSELLVQHYSNETNPLRKQLDLPYSPVEELKVGYLGTLLSYPQSPAFITDRPLRAAKVVHTRRMPRDEIHYVDHPLLGLVMLVNRVEDSE